MKTQLAFQCTGPIVEGCAEDIWVPIDEPLTLDSLSDFLAQHGWYLSVITPPGQGPTVPLTHATICRACAKTVMPELVEAADRIRLAKQISGK